MKIKSLFAILLTVISFAAAWAAKPVVTSKLDSAGMLMGTVRTLHLEVVQDKGVRGEFPLFREFGEREYVGLLNDTVELSRNMKVDTADVGSGRIKIDYKVPVQVFDSGTYRIPGFVFICGRDSAVSKPLFLTVNPVKVKADDQISPFTDVADPENSSIFDTLPDWLVNWWWLMVLVLILLVGGYLLYRRYKQKGSILPSKPATPPYELAMQRLQRLKARKLWETGKEKDFYTILTDILRTYLDGRFGISAMEMTSREIMERLSEDPSLRESRSKMRQILDMADFVKFAMVRPLPDDNVKAFDNAVAFVESTKPAPKVEADAAGNVAADENSPQHISKNNLSADKTVSGKHNFRIVHSKSRDKKRKGGEK